MPKNKKKRNQQRDPTTQEENGQGLELVSHLTVSDDITTITDPAFATDMSTVTELTRQADSCVENIERDSEPVQIDSKDDQLRMDSMKTLNNDPIRIED